MTHLVGRSGAENPEAWLPHYMRFPMGGYTKRKGLPAVELWNAVRKLF